MLPGLLTMAVGAVGVVGVDRILRWWSNGRGNGRVVRKVG